MNGNPEKGRAAAAAAAAAAAGTDAGAGDSAGAATAALAGEESPPFTWQCSLRSADLWKVSRGSLFIDLPLLALLCSP